MRPRITGPGSWPEAGRPPRFDVDTAGHAFFMVEMSAARRLMAAITGRSAENYFFGADADGAVGTGDSWTVPAEVWERLSAAPVLYYRVIAFDQDPGDSLASVDDQHLGDLPALAVHRAGDGAADVAALCGGLGISVPRFELSEDWYFARLGELLSFHGIVERASAISRTTFRDAVAGFQTANGLAVDGIVGPATAWALNHPWALQRKLPLVEVEVDTADGPGGRIGPGTIALRADAVGAVARLRTDLAAAGVPLVVECGTGLLDTRAGACAAAPTHHCGVAVDLAGGPGTPYLVTHEGPWWRIWARSATGEERVLDTVEPAGHGRTPRRHRGSFVDVSTVAAVHGLAPASPRSGTPASCGRAAWQHFEHEDVLVPWLSQLGAEILSVDGQTDADLQARPRLWADRALLFHGGARGWA